MTELALPEPKHVELAQIPKIIRISQDLREKYERDSDLAGAEELKRKLLAFTKYLSDKEARTQLELETRRVEVLIGKLLGPAQHGGDRRSEKSTSIVEDDPGLAHVLAGSQIGWAERSRVRALAANEELVEQLLSEGVTKRAVILREISGEPKPTNGSTPLQDGEFRCPHCKRPVTLENLLTE